mmetsp:Transcript_15625/g.48878  ORF Transcript_15625/g.48878 Transcript_15625/m.48878 type:complete len:346 (+) Transcript_15625:138-1175(+)
MTLEGPDLATNVVKELTLIKERVAHLEEENAMLKRHNSAVEVGRQPRPGEHRTPRYRNGVVQATPRVSAAVKRRPGVVPTGGGAPAAVGNHVAIARGVPSKMLLVPKLLQARPDDHVAREAPAAPSHRVAVNGYVPSLGDETRRAYGRNIWVGSEHRSLQVSHELLGAALPDAVRGFPVAIFAKYEDNVNTAIKGAAIAAERLREQGRHVGVEASFRENRNEVTLMVVDIPRTQWHDDKLSLQPQTDEKVRAAPDRGALTVASQTDYKVLGGAVANRVRDNKPTLLRAIGKRAVWAATRAVAVAREYVVETGPNLVFSPRFNSVQLSNRTEPSTVVELFVFALDK